eukprot:329770-Amphidinium_carterae.1
MAGEGEECLRVMIIDDDYDDDDDDDDNLVDELFRWYVRLELLLILSVSCCSCGIRHHTT